MVENHNRSTNTSYSKFPRSSCSLSIASNRDLKFPAPKPEKLLRWMISIKTVGRSMRCCNHKSVTPNTSKLRDLWIVTLTFVNSCKR